MNKRFINTLAACFVLLTNNLFGQQNNIFHDRNFWKAQPSIETIKQKIQEGHSPTALTAHSFDAIGYAILENNSLETVKFLLGQGNDINKLTHDARTYLFWAAYRGNLALMKYLVEHGAKTDIIDQHGYSVFMFSAVTGQENQGVYDYLVELGVDAASERDRSGKNALLTYASGMKSLKMIPYFIEKGLDIHSVDKDGNGIFNYAAKTGNSALLEQLLGEYKVSIEANPKTNENAILFASSRSSRSGETKLEVFEYLEELGQDPLIISKTGKTALHNLAYRSNNKELFDHFLAKEIDVNLLDNEGNNVLVTASSRRKKEILEPIIERTKDINHKNKEGISSLTKALMYNDLEVVKFLVSKGANINVIDKKGFDLGYHLVDAFRRDMDTFNKKMAYLISLGYDPKAVQEDGSTLLHVAIDKKNIALVKQLLAMGIDINAKDNAGQTVLHKAAMQADPCRFPPRTGPSPR